MAELRLNSAIYGIQRSGIREFMALAKRMPGCISLTIGEPEFTTPKPICSEAKASLDAGRTHYIENNGEAFLREAIAEFEASHSNLNYSADEVIVTLGATEGIFCALLCLLDPGDEVIVPTPAFNLYEQTIGLCRGRFVPLDTTKNGFQIDSQALAAAITEKTKAIILNSPNNPTGCVLNEASLQAVKKAVSGSGIFVLCDDVYRQLCYAPNYHSFAEFSDMKERVIVIQSFSKPYAMTGWRAGYLMADLPVKQQMEKAHQYMVVSTPSFVQSACVTALQSDPAPMIAEYEKRRNYVCQSLSEMGLPVIAPEGAFYAFPSIERFGLNSLEFCTRLVKQAGLALTPGGAFGAPNNVRLSYCCDTAQLTEGLNRLRGFLNTL